MIRLAVKARGSEVQKTMAKYTKTERKNDRSSLMRFTPFLYLSGGGSVVHYITGAEMPQEAISPCLLSKP